MTKVLHVLQTYFQDSIGGTEIYVRGLATRLLERGVDCVVCAPGPSERAYEHSGVRVRRFAGMAPAFEFDHVYGDGDPVAAEAFCRILDEEKPDLVHAHALTAEVSLAAARAVKSRGIPLVFTYHSAATTCAVGTLLKDRRQPCAGRLEARACAACNLRRLGMPKPLSGIVGRVPPAIGKIVGRSGIRGRPATALRMQELIARKHAAAREFLSLADALVAPSRWVRDLLVENGVPVSKISLCGQGIEHSPVERVPTARRTCLRIAALARLDAMKGMHILLEALRARPALDVRLDIFVAPPAGVETAYGRRLRREASGDARVRLLPPLAHEAVVRALADYDAVAVPSQVLETGPLVVLEAFAAKTPVIASDLGGIAERVSHGVDGLLIPPFEADAWGSAIERLARDPALLARLRAGVPDVPSMDDVTEAMHSLYARLWAATAAVPVASTTSAGGASRSAGHFEWIPA
ncbi:MAG TPA: glycosyltransferase [Usitatibacter sp.]|nr:glycosyltransferase [Usitatibacter sp.]